MAGCQLYNVWTTFFYATLLSGYVGTSPLFVCEQAEQSSTNGSFLASFGCDDDMDTFSLTNDGADQSWSVKLNESYRIYWIFISANTEEYQMFIVNNKPQQIVKYKCLPEGHKLISRQRLMTCVGPDYTIGNVNEITIHQIGNGALKVFEVKPVGLSPLSPTMIQNYADILVPTSKALDGDMNTFYQSVENTQASWFLTLDKNYVIEWILLSIRGGHYEVHVQDGTKITSSSTLCQKFSFTGLLLLNQNYKALQCSREMTGNTIVITRTDDGPLRLFEVHPIICPENHYGPNCAKCKAECRSCSPINGVCYQCQDAFYGDFCQHTCPGDCLNSTCSQSTGICEGCNGAFYGDFCQHTCPVNCLNSICNQTTGTCEGCNGAFYGDFCNNTCPENCLNSICDQRTGKCEGCDDAFYGDDCQYRCPVNCFNSKCDQANGTCGACIEGYHGMNCDSIITTEQITHSTTSDEDTSTIKEKDAIQDVVINEDDQTLSIIVLSILVVVAVCLVFAVIALFKKGKKTPKLTSVEVNVEFHRVESRNESELEEIPQNEAGDVEDEIITVEYSNLTSQRIPIDQFIGELPEKKSNGTLEKEFNDLPTGLLETYSIALKASNRHGNRYRGIYPYDYNRVKLMRTDGNENDDFVNASYIHGFNKEQAYIAAQGPFNLKTLEDFWTLIWQNDSTRIVNLTNLYEGDRMKCLKYWPDTELDIGPYTIKLDTVDVYNHYVLRYMLLQCQEEEKEVTQFHFTSWPDKSVPEDLTSLIVFRNLVRNGLTTSDGPIVVHCSAGIGRTGTFISLDYLLEEGAAEQTIDVKGYIASLRQQRGGSVQTCDQYIFLHEALVEGITNTNAHHGYLSVL